MNKRRWVAVIIAIGLFVVSTIISVANTRTQTDGNELDRVSSWIYGSDILSEKVIEAGSSSDKIVRLQVDGTIQSTTSSSLFSTSGYNHDELLRQLDVIAQDSQVKGVLLEVNSPGGGVYESAELAKKLKVLQTDHDLPIYVSMKNMAASGGYYISANADKIFATDETVTGSIGVIMSGINYSGLLEKLGIEDTTVKSGALKDAGSSTRPETEADKEVLQAYIDSAYGRFVDIVSEGRGMKEETVRQLADGRIYDGAQAKENGLIDEIGFPEDALAALRKDYKLQNAQLVEYTTTSTGMANTLFGSAFAEFSGYKASETNQVLQLLENLGTAEAPKAMYLYGGE